MIALMRLHNRQLIRWFYN